MTPTDIRDRETFATDEAGGITALNLFLFFCMAMLGSLAMDMANVVSARTQLQVAADTAAHAALVARIDGHVDAETAKARGVEFAKMNMPSEAYGDVLTATNIHFGTYDKATKTFTIDDTQSDFIFVQTERVSANSNAVSAFLTNILGIDSFDVVTTSVWETYVDPCDMEGLVGELPVDMQSGNVFLKGFCTHSNDWVELNSGNDFHSGSNVSMPETDNLVLPTSGMDSNVGVEDALVEGNLDIRILDRLDDIKAGMTDDTSEYFRDFITDDKAINITTKGDLLASDLTEGRVHKINCTGSGTLTFTETYKNAVIITDCDLKFNGSVLENMTVITTSTNDKSITASSEPIFGADDHCKPGGGVQLITYGGYDSASKVSMYGSQLIAKGHVKYAAKADGVEGMSIIAGGEIDSTSGSTYGPCNTGMEDNFVVRRFRMVG